MHGYVTPGLSALWLITFSGTQAAATHHLILTFTLCWPGPERHARCRGPAGHNGVWMTGRHRGPFKRLRKGASACGRLLPGGQLGAHLARLRGGPRGVGPERPGTYRDALAVAFRGNPN